MLQEKHKTKDFSSTVRYSNHPCFAQRARVLPVPDMVQWGKYRLRDELKLIKVILQAALQEKVLLLFSSRGFLKPDLLATAIMGLWPKSSRPRVVLYGEMFEPNTNLRGLLERWIMKLADRAIYRYVVNSTDELHVFAETWRVERAKLRFCPTYFPEVEVDAVVERKVRRGHLFAGGDSLRDYEPLIEAAKQLPEYQFVFCTTRLDKHKDLPVNVKIGPTQRQQYLELMDTASAVVIPLRQGLRRPVGLFTLLGAMWTKKPTIVPTALGVQDYALENSVRVVDGSAQSYVEAIRWMLAPENVDRVDEMCETAHRIVRRQCTRDCHIECLLAILDEASQGIA